MSKSGDARIALVGFPSVGKSTFLSKITKTKSEVAAYSFTTLTAIPGVLEYGGAEIQILDLPGIIEGASEGKGRGRQVISAAKVGHSMWYFCGWLHCLRPASGTYFLPSRLSSIFCSAQKIYYALPFLLAPLTAILQIWTILRLPTHCLIHTPKNCPTNIHLFSS